MISMNKYIAQWLYIIRSICSGEKVPDFTGMSAGLGVSRPGYGLSPPGRAGEPWLLPAPAASRSGPSFPGSAGARILR